MEATSGEGSDVAAEARKEASAGEDESATSRWPGVEAAIAEDDGPGNEAGSRSLPPTPRRPLVPPPPRIEASSSGSGMRVPTIDSQSSGFRAPTLDSQSSSSGIRVSDDGWDLEDAEDDASKAAGEPSSGPRPLAPPPPMLGSPLPRPRLPAPPPAAPLPSPTAEHMADDETPAAPEAEAETETEVPAGEPQAAEASAAGPPSDEGASDDPVASVPRLPVPGMLRDGSIPKAADFRATPRQRPQTAAAMPPPSGSLPPRMRPPQAGDAAALGSQNTMQLVAEVATELIEQVKADAEAKQAHAAAAAAVAAAAAAESVSTEVAPRVAPTLAAAAPTEAARAVPMAAAVTRDEAKRRRMIVGVGLLGTAAALVLVIGLATGGDDEPAPQLAAAPAAVVPSTPDPGEAVADPPPTPEPTPAAGSTGPASDDETPADDTTSAAVEAAASTGSADEEEAGADAGEDADEPQAVASTSEGKSSSGKRSGGKASRAKSEPAKDEPKAAPAPKEDKELSAEELLKRARSAYAAGKGQSAYSMASKSNKMRPSGDAAEVMALSACAMNNADKARNALKNVPLFKRGGVRTTCKNKHGVKIPL